MNFRALFIRMGKKFPHPIRMDDIHKMPRRKLTASEETRPYAKYFHKQLAPIPQKPLVAKGSRFAIQARDSQSLP